VKQGPCLTRQSNWLEMQRYNKKEITLKGEIDLIKTQNATLTNIINIKQIEGSKVSTKLLEYEHDIQKLIRYTEDLIVREVNIIKQNPTNPQEILNQILQLESPSNRQMTIGQSYFNEYKYLPKIDLPNSPVVVEFKLFDEPSSVNLTDEQISYIGRKQHEDVLRLLQNQNGLPTQTRQILDRQRQERLITGQKFLMVPEVEVEMAIESLEEIPGEIGLD